MKHTTIKSAIICLLATLLQLWGTVSASAQYYQLKVRTNDGLITPFNVGRVDSLYFEFVGPVENGNDEDETTVTGNATDITTYTATITSWANILDNLSTDLKVGIIYTSQGTPSKSNGTQKIVSTSSLGSDAKYTINLTSLAPATTYYYRSFVYQSGIWFYGDVKSFTTKGLGVELVSGEVTKLTCYSAKLSGAVSIDESTQYQSLSYGICYSTGSTPTVNNTRLQASSKDQDGNFTVQLRALTGSTTYYYRSYAYVDSYLSYGPIRSFTTKDDDVVITGVIDTTTYSVKSTLKIGSGAYSSLELGVCYGINSTPTVKDQIVTTNEVDDENNFILSLKNIPFGTTVYYRSFIKIDGVAHYGEIKNFYLPMPIGEAVDLGLSVKWASFNVGAAKPADYGNYYAWGETKTNYSYTWTNYKFRTSGDSWDNVKFSKYNTSSSYGTVDNKTTLDPEDDVAHVKWGGSWRMPTKAELDELLKNCTWTWYSSENTEFNGVAGYKVTSNKSDYTDRFIFLPAAGYRSDTILYQVGLSGFYLSSSHDSSHPYEAWYLLSSVHSRYTERVSRYYGQSVRPVCPRENLSISLDNTSLLLEVGKTCLLKATVMNEDEVLSKTINWESDNLYVATVTAEGLVKAMSVGTATITASCQGNTASCMVIISEASSQEEVQYEYVDLGLSVKWATFNVGATSPEEYGDYYAWGETESKTTYGVFNYKWWNNSSSTLTKYNTSSSYGTVDNKAVLDPEDDVAHVKWGGSWRMPTETELEELQKCCTWTKYNSGNTEFNGVAGYKVTSNVPGFTDRFIFLPVAGYCDWNVFGGFEGIGSNVFYWSSSLYLDDPIEAWHLYFEYGKHHYRIRYDGLSVRPVYPSEEWLNAVSITLNSNLDSIVMGNTITLSATVKHGNEVIDRGVTWISDNPSIASVSETGVVTAIAVGSTTITAICMGKTATCTITVIDQQYENGYEYVDLGLSVKWATCNVGATKPGEYGDYYAWGETETKTSYTWTNYKFRTSGDSRDNVKFSKYNTSSSYGTVDNKTVLDLEDDVAHVKWGGSWRIPTKAEQDELLHSCTWTWYSSGNTEFNGVAGCKVTSNVSGYTDRSIFLPAAGYRNGASLYYVGFYGNYWSSSLYTDYPYGAWFVYFNSDYYDTYNYSRYGGLSVRPVCP